MQPGRCYKIVLADGTSEVFKFINHDADSGQMKIEAPAGSGNFTTYERQYPGACKSRDEADCPR